jgi:hypothetical protein
MPNVFTDFQMLDPLSCIAICRRVPSALRQSHRIGLGHAYGVVSATVHLKPSCAPLLVFLSAAFNGVAFSQATSYFMGHCGHGGVSEALATGTPM